MSERPALGAVVRIGGDLYECYAFSEGVSVHFRKVGAPACEHCGQAIERSYLLHAPNYAEVKPVETLRVSERSDGARSPSDRF